MARIRSAETTRAAILDAARIRFGSEGYERTTMRAVAGDVGVDAAMVVRYFKTKDALFAEAATFELHLPDLSGLAPKDLAAALMPTFFDVWEDDGTFLSLLRASATSSVAAQTMLEVFVRQVSPALTAVTPDRHADRAALAGSQILGLAFSRYVLRVPPLVKMTHDEIVDWVGPTLTRYLTEIDPY
nr:TetR family transcriptional regulator [Rhodococcus sp. (in: high G+C Gram-positive bacteria)]